MKRSHLILSRLRESDQPWVKYHAQKLMRSRSSELPDLKKTMLDTVLLQDLLKACCLWPGLPLKNHKQAKHTLHKLSFLSDLGLKKEDPLIDKVLRQIFAHQDNSGAFQMRILLPKVLGGNNRPTWGWMNCDLPIILYSLLAMGLEKQIQVQKALKHLVGLVTPNGWSCTSSFTEFKGPGRKEDPCPYANLLCLKALALSTKFRKSDVSHKGTEMLLTHWQQRKQRKIRMFGIGTDFQKLKYPLVWYDILHVVDVLSQFPWTHHDERFKEMLDVIFAKANKRQYYTPESVWLEYKGYDFGQKKQPSPTLTWVVERIKKRISTSLL